MFANRSIRNSVALALLAFACDESAVAPPPPTIDSADGEPVFVEWQHPHPQGNDLYRMWGFSDGTFYGVGAAGTVVHFDGADVSQMDAPTRNDLRGIWATDQNNIYTAGLGGTLLRYDGASWQNVNSPTKNDLRAVYADPSGDLFVAGTGGSVCRRTSGAWTEYAVAPGRRFNALWGYSPTEVYVAGSSGAMYRFDGVDWNRMIVLDRPTYDAEVLDLWGPTPGSISIINRSVIIWFDGAVWDLAALKEVNAYGLWGLSLDAQVGVSAGSSSHWDGSSMTRILTPSPHPLYDVWGPAANNYYAVGKHGTMAHFDGTSWASMSAGTLSDVRDMCVSQNSAVAVGANGVVLRQNGSSWLDEAVSDSYDLSGVWTTAGLSVAVGRYTPDLVDWRQAILVDTGTGWTDVGVVGEAYRLFDVWGSSAIDVYAVGWAGEILHYDGNSWSVADSGNAGDAAFLQGVHGSAQDNVIAVGRTNDLRGLVCRYDGTTWSKSVIAGVEELCDVWVGASGVAFAVGSFGAIWRFDGMSWAKMSSPTTEKLLSVWGASENDIYATGWWGTVLHYDGSVWKRLVPATNRNLNVVAGRSSGEIYFAGDKGAVLRFGGF